VGETLWRVIFLNDSGLRVGKFESRAISGASAPVTEGARVGILETCDFRTDVRQGGKNPMEAIGAAQDFEGRGMVDPEGDSRPMGGVGTSVPASEAAKDRKAVETAEREP